MVKELGGIHLIRFSSCFLQSNQFHYWKYTSTMVTKRGEEILKIFHEHVFPFGSERAPGGKRSSTAWRVLCVLPSWWKPRARAFRAKSDEKALRDWTRIWQMWSVGRPAGGGRGALAKSSAFITMDFFGAPSANACYSQIFYQIQFHCILVRQLRRKIYALFVCCRRPADNL